MGTKYQEMQFRVNLVQWMVQVDELISLQEKKLKEIEEKIAQVEAKVARNRNTATYGIN